MKLQRLTLGALALLTSHAVLSQTQPPDAGRLLDEATRPSGPPAPAKPFRFRIPRTPGVPAATPPATDPGVRLFKLQIEGLTDLDPEEIAASIPLTPGQTLDTATLQQLAAAVEEAVRSRGLVFARAFVPSQDLSGGVLRIGVLEGRYGDVFAEGESADQAQHWLYRLRPGQPIMIAPLERALLLLGDLPGVAASSSLSPGEEVGTGDLAVQLEPVPGVSGQVGADNHGNRYAGNHRAYVNLATGSSFTFGDQIRFYLMRSSESTHAQSLAYELPIGTDGARLEVGWLRSSYKLGKEFAALEAQGLSEVRSGGVSYPMLRSRDANLRLGGTYRDAKFRDERRAFGLVDEKQTQVVDLNLAGDRRTERSVSSVLADINLGRLRLQGDAAAADALSSKSNGNYIRMNLELSSLQGMGPATSVYARTAVQAASKNLDASEKLSLGGPTKVRAWPNGEASGDQGGFIQLEARGRLQTVEPYVFVDAGQVQAHRKPWDTGSNRRSLAGYGVGVRWMFNGGSANLLAARRSSNEASRSEPASSRERVWFNIAYSF